LYPLLDKCRNCKSRCHSAFQNIKDDTLEEIDRLRSLVKFKTKNNLIFVHDDQPGYYCIRSGQLSLSIKSENSSKTVAFCGPSDFIGFSFSNNYFNLNLEAHALTDGEACFIPSTAIQNLKNYSTHLTNGIINKLNGFIQLQYSRIFSLEKLKAKNRVGSLLLTLCNKFGKSSSYGILIDIKIDRIVLAQMACTVPETFARILSELENENIIKREGRKLHILNQSKLQKFIAQ